MACFLVPAAEAVITTVASKVIEKKESSPETVHISLDDSTITEAVKIPFSHKLKWLNSKIYSPTIATANGKSKHFTAFSANRNRNLFLFRTAKFSFCCYVLKSYQSLSFSIFLVLL